MAIIKCKMCGGDIELSADKTYGTCDSCGSTMTFPKVDDEHRANLFNRANHFRRQNEFDKAISAYERILDEDNADAEAHWGVVLSRFGIEYVEDPVSHERIPTCHRVQTVSILTDADYLAACEYAPDSYSRSLYEAEAKRIADIQKGILAISSQEKPYDVFICYKESTEGGSRTKDSTIAQDIYYQLKQEGFNVFFARITLEDKLGQQYEPYIFAALNSAKVMLVVGTKPEYFNAVWVKNEWSRYLALMKQDRSRLLIPCYRDMDAYDLPDELSTLQSQDMSKIGFMQDLIRGVKKVLGASQPKQATQVAAAAPTSAAAPLLRRAFMFLEDGDWMKADEFCEQVLNLEPENAEAYLGKLMANLEVGKREQLKDYAAPFDDEADYTKAMRFGDTTLKAELQGYIQHINERNEQARLERLYQSACDHEKQAQTELDYKNAAREFEAIGQYKDAAEKTGVCYAKAEIARKDEIYAAGKHAMALDSQDAYAAAICMFESIPGWKDADELIPACQRKMQELKEKAEADRLARERTADQARIKAEEEARKRKQRNTILAALAVAAVAVFLLVTQVIIPNQKYNAAWDLMKTGKYEEAIAAFTEIKDHRDSAKQIETCETAILDDKYNTAVALMNKGNDWEAYTIFDSLNGYRDSAMHLYNIARTYETNGNKGAAAIIYNKAGNIEDAQARSTTLWHKIVIHDTIAVGSKYTVGLKSSNGIYGAGDIGLIDFDSVYASAWQDLKNGDFVSISGGNLHVVVLKADGTVAAGGDSPSKLRSRISHWKDIVAIYMGKSDYAVGLKADGTVVVAGNGFEDENNQCDTSDWKDIIAICTGSGHIVGLRADGTVVATGYNSDGQCNVSNWKDIVAIYAGDYHTIGIKTDGTVVAVGKNSNGQCNVSNWKNIIAIYATYSHTVGLKADGTVVATGNNYNGQCNVSNWKNIIAICAGDGHTVGLKADGTVVAVGRNFKNQCNVGDWKDIIAIYAGDDHTVGLKADGTVVAVGDNSKGQCNVNNWRLKQVTRPQR